MTYRLAPYALLLSQAIAWAAPSPWESVLAAGRQEMIRQEQVRASILDELEFGPASKRACLEAGLVPDGSIDAHRSLLVHDAPTLEARDFGLRAVLAQLATQASARAPGTTALALFREFWATQSNRLASDPSGSPRCNDAGGTLNGFPYPCRPGEGSLVRGSDAQVSAALESFKPVALVNRIDLAHAGWRNCGEYRIVYNTPLDDKSESLIIFEAVLPNPLPGCASKCKEVARFWEGLSREPDPAARAEALHAFFFEGLPGFRPVIHIDHYSARGVPRYGGSGSGQIRTNSFQTDPWDLREFKTSLDCSAGPCALRFPPIPVRNSAYDPLWSQEVAERGGALGPVAQRFQASVLAQMDDLSRPLFPDLSFNVGAEALAGHQFQSLVIGGDARQTYRSGFDPAGSRAGSFPFRRLLDSAAAAHGLTSEAILQRAQGVSCAGCHKPSTFGLGVLQPGLATVEGAPMTAWPSADFKHIHGRPRATPGATGAYTLSPALDETFLPARVRGFIDFLQAPDCPCSHRFRGFALSDAQRARIIEDSVSQAFAPRLEVLAQEIAWFSREKDPKDGLWDKLRILRSDYAAMDEYRERVTLDALAAAGVMPSGAKDDLNPQTAIPRKPEWDNLPEMARPDSLAAYTLREAFREPFRRTVGKTMPTH